jgi:hypothetical protein
MAAEVSTIGCLKDLPKVRLQEAGNEYWATKKPDECTQIKAETKPTIVNLMKNV